jgi:hypothetical protein
MNELQRLRKQYDEYSDLTDQEFVDKISNAKGKEGKLKYPTLSKRLQGLLPKEGKKEIVKDDSPLVRPQRINKILEEGV